MSLMTGEEYIESIRKRKMQVYLFGKKVEDPVDDPIPVSYTHLDVYKRQLDRHSGANYTGTI